MPATSWQQYELPLYKNAYPASFVEQFTATTPERERSYVYINSNMIRILQQTEGWNSKLFFSKHIHEFIQKAEGRTSKKLTK